MAPLGDEEALALFRDRGALREGHFELASGLHAARYFQCQAVLADPRAARRLCEGLAARVASWEPALVLGPALGAIVIAHEVAAALGCRTAFAERQDGVFALRRGQTVSPGERVLIAENVVTTGGSAREVIRLVEDLGGVVVGVASLVDRSPDGAPFAPLPLCSLLRLAVPTHAAGACPLCAAGLPLERPGSSKAKGGRA